MRVHGQLIAAQFENVTSDPTPTAQTIGRGIFRTDTKEYKVLGDATTWLTFADLTSAQTFQNKILQRPQINGGFNIQNLSSNPTNPTSGFTTLFTKPSGGLFSLDENGVETEVGGAGGIDVGYESQFLDNDITRNVGISWVESSATGIENINLGDPASVPGLVFYAQGFSFTNGSGQTTTTVNTNSGTIPFDGNAPFSNAAFKPVHAFYSDGSTWRQIGTKVPNADQFRTKTLSVSASFSANTTDTLTDLKFPALENNSTYEVHIHGKLSIQNDEDIQVVAVLNDNGVRTGVTRVGAQGQSQDGADALVLSAGASKIFKTGSSGVQSLEFDVAVSGGSVTVIAGIGQSYVTLKKLNNITENNSL